MLLYFLTIALMGCCTQTLKYSIRRERPQQRDDTTRFVNLRSKEKKTFSMPSGDASCAAAFCAVIAYEYGAPQIYAIMPFVMLGRVYY